MSIGIGKKKKQERNEQEQKPVEKAEAVDKVEAVKKAEAVDKAEAVKKAANKAPEDESQGELDDVNETQETEKTEKDKKKKRGRKHSGKKEKSDQIIRIEELEALMQKYGDDIDPDKMEDIVSMYVPHRKRRKIGAALLRLDRMQLLLLVLMLVVCILFITAFMQEKMGNFTINLNRLELYRKGISISDSGDFENATARLTASNVKDATNISIEDIPEDVDDIEGGHNGKNYMAYTYYLRNAGKEDLRDHHA